MLAPFLKYIEILVVNRPSEPTYPTSIWRRHWGWPSLNFAVNFGVRKRVPGLSYGGFFVILCLAVLVQCRLVTDGRTHDDSIYRA